MFAAEEVPTVPTVIAPVLAIVASPVTGTVFQEVPFAIRMFLSVAVVVPRATPLILSTEVAP